MSPVTKLFHYCQEHCRCNRKRSLSYKERHTVHSPVKDVFVSGAQVNGQRVEGVSEKVKPVCERGREREKERESPKCLFLFLFLTPLPAPTCSSSLPLLLHQRAARNVLPNIYDDTDAVTVLNIKYSLRAVDISTL